MDGLQNVVYAALNRPWTAVVLLIATYAITSFFIATFSTQTRFWRNQAWAGQQKGLFSAFRSGLKSIRGLRTMLYDAYQQYSKNGQPFTIHQFAQEPTMIIPHSMIREFVQQPEESINLLVVLHDVMAVRYTGDSDLTANPVHLDVVRNQLTRKLPLLTAEVHAELVLGFEDQWKVSLTEWTPIPAIKTCNMIVSRAANRVFSGAKLCRTPEWLEHTRIYGQSIFMEAGVINILPWYLRPFAAPWITRHNAKHIKACQRLAFPIIEERIQALREGIKGDVPNDALQWVIEKVYETGDPVELDPDRLTRRLMRLNMVANHTTTLTITNTLIDLFSSPRREEFTTGLREECTRVLASTHGLWNKTAVNSLHRIDSAIKESMRCSSIGLTGLMRQVTSPTGITLPDGTHVPSGIRIAAPIHPIHHDPDFYPSPDEYDAFRFSRSREELGSKGNVLDARHQAIVTTSESFLPFGHGRHACPGRFFASQEMKLMLAHIVLNYDVRIDGPRPKNIEIRGASFPSSKVMLMVRKRATEDL